MPRYLVVDRATKRIINVILLEDVDGWAPPEGHDLVEDVNEEADIDGEYDNGVYTPPDYPPPPQPEPDDPALAPIDILLAKADADITAGEVKQIVLYLARRLRARRVLR